MAIERSRTLSPIRKDIGTQRQNQLKLADINLDNKILEMMCKMLVTNNQTVRRSQLLNLKNFIYGINPDTYLNDPDKSKYISFIKKGLEGRLDFNLTDPYTIIRHINGGILDDGVVDIDNFGGLSGEDINWLNNAISETLKYAYIYNATDQLIDICTRFKTASYGSKESIVRDFESAINQVQNNFRKARNETHTEVTFSLADGDFEDCICDTYNQLASPRRKLITGMQGMNELLGGGFECGRCYVFFGLPGEGKSTTLLNLVYQIKKYNVDYKPKDPTKVPCIVLLTMENTVTESVERLFGISTGRSNMIDFDVRDVIEMMKKDGGLFLDNASPINIIIKFVPTNSVDTSYLYTFTEDLEDQGYEVIAFVQDYIGRIRSTERYQDTRLEYGAVADEFKTFAEIKDIPVITASQLNRDASKHIDEGRKNNKADLVRFLGRSNISESMLILNNIDAGYVIAPEVTQEGERYLGIQRIKIRYRAGDMEYAYLPYHVGCVSFEEDFGGIPKFKTTLRSDCPMMGSIKQSQYQTNAIMDMGQILPKDDDNNIFADANIVSMTDDLDTLAANMAVTIPTITEYHPVIFDIPDSSIKQLYCPVIFDK